MFYNEILLQWSKSSTKAFISITDLINYGKNSWKVDKLNGLKEEEDKMKVVLSVTLYPE